MHRFKGALAVAGAVIPRHQHVRTDGQAEEYVYDQVDQRAGGTHRSKGFAAGKPAHHHDVRCVVQKLQHAGQHQRQRKYHYLRYQLAVGHIQLKGFLLLSAQLHGIPPDSISDCIIWPEY